MRTHTLMLRHLAAVTVLLLAACASTTFTSTWKAPDVQALKPAGKTIAAVFVSRNESRRRSAEDLLAADISRRGAHGVAAYALLPDDLRGDGAAARAKLKAAGVDGVVVMRVVGRDQRVSYTPAYVMPAYYGAFGPYWGYGWGSVYQPGYLQSDTVVSVETLVYSLTRDQLLWASTSRTTNPRDLDNLVSEVADATTREMIRQELLAP
jgi:hypothetical protein